MVERESLANTRLVGVPVGPKGRQGGDGTPSRDIPRRCNLYSQSAARDTRESANTLTNIEKARRASPLATKLISVASPRLTRKDTMY